MMDTMRTALAAGVAVLWLASGCGPKTAVEAGNTDMPVEVYHPSGPVTEARRYMPKVDVLAVLGVPSRVWSDGDYTVWSYDEFSPVSGGAISTDLYAFYRGRMVAWRVGTGVFEYIEVNTPDGGTKTLQIGRPESKEASWGGEKAE